MSQYMTRLSPIFVAVLAISFIAGPAFGEAKLTASQKKEIAKAAKRAADKKSASPKKSSKRFAKRTKKIEPLVDPLSPF